MNRLPNNEVLRPYAPELLRIATETLSRDTEENALTCLRIIFDLHKNFRPALEGEVQCFLDLVQRIYRLLPTSINKAFFISLPDQRRLLSIFFFLCILILRFTSSDCVRCLQSPWSSSEM